MTDVHISWEDTVDPQACVTDQDFYHYVSRDPARTPLQWNSDHNAGFSTANKTWLPLAESYADKNIELQMAQSQSHLKVFKALLELRSHPTMRYGTLFTVIHFTVRIYSIRFKYFWFCFFIVIIHPSILSLIPAQF